MIFLKNWLSLLDPVDSCSEERKYLAAKRLFATLFRLSFVKCNNIIKLPEHMYTIYTDSEEEQKASR